MKLSYADLLLIISYEIMITDMHFLCPDLDERCLFITELKHISGREVIRKTFIERCVTS